MRRLALGLAAVVAAVSAVVASQATADEAPLPTGPSIVGIHAPCPVGTPWPGKDVPISELKDRFTETFGLKLTGPYLTEEYREQFRILWESLDALNCTTFLPTIAEKNGQIGVNAGPIRGYAWGDWSLTKDGHVTFDFRKWQEVIDGDDPGRLSRLIIHEFTHAWNSDRFGNPRYWRDFTSLTKKEGHFSDYAGSRDTEIIAEVVGYYVARCASDNPYDSGKHFAYYQWVKKNVFDGREFGPEPGTKATCDVTAEDIAAATPASEPPTQPAWIEALSGE